MNYIGLDGCPKADAMLRRVDPYGIAQGDGALSGPPSAAGRTQAGEILAVVAAALAAGAAVAMVIGASTGRHAQENPRKKRRSDAEVEDLAKQVIRDSGQAEVQAIAKKGWPYTSGWRGDFTQRERAAIKREAKRELRR